MVRWNTSLPRVEIIQAWRYSSSPSPIASHATYYIQPRSPARYQHSHIYINNIYSYTSVSTRGTHSLRTAHRSLQVSAPTFTFPHLSLAHSRTRPPHPARYVFTSGQYYTSQYHLTTIPRSPYNGKLGRRNNPRCIHMIV